MVRSHNSNQKNQGPYLYVVSSGAACNFESSMNNLQQQENCAQFCFPDEPIIILDR